METFGGQWPPARGSQKTYFLPRSRKPRRVGGPFRQVIWGTENIRNAHGGRAPRGGRGREVPLTKIRQKNNVVNIYKPGRPAASRRAGLRGVSFLRRGGHPSGWCFQVFSGMSFDHIG